VTEAPTDAVASGGDELGPEFTRHVRRRMQAALEVMAERAAPVPTGELYTEAVERVPLQPVDEVTTTQGVPRWRNFLGWNLSATCQHAGYLVRGNVSWRLTTAGESALRQASSPEELYGEAEAGYQEWERLRKEALLSPQAGSPETIVHPGPAAAHVLRAVDPVVEA